MVFPDQISINNYTAQLITENYKEFDPPKAPKAMKICLQVFQPK